MPKSLNFKWDNQTAEATLQKIDRKKIYGYVELDVFDDNNQKCELATISSDGKYILPSGTTGIMSLDADGNYISRSDMKVIDLAGKPMQKLPSSYDGDVELQESSIEQYLDLNVKAIYTLNIDPEAEIAKAMKAGKIFHFQYNYRADYKTDDAFMLANDTGFFVVLGVIMNFEYIELETQIETSDEEEEEEDDFDMGMF